jgi:hypothetical protein
MVKVECFAATILDGHKGSAVEVPFDPAERWSIPAGPLWVGRWGHHVRGTLDEVPFESVVVPRSRRFYALVDDALKAVAGVDTGDRVDVSLQPAEVPAGRSRRGARR